MILLYLMEAAAITWLAQATVRHGRRTVGATGPWAADDYAFLVLYLVLGFLVAAVFNALSAPWRAP